MSWCPGVLVSLISIAHGSYCGCHEYLNNDHDFEFISSLMYIRRTYVAKVSFFTRTHEKLRRADLRRAPPPYIKQYCHRDRCTLQLFSVQFLIIQKHTKSCGGQTSGGHSSLIGQFYYINIDIKTCTLQLFS